MMLTKYLVVVDDDVDVHNTSEVLFRLCANTDPQRDSIFTQRPVRRALPRHVENGDGIKTWIRSSVPATMHVYEARPPRDKRGVDLISDVLPFGRLWYGYSRVRFPPPASSHR